MSKYDAAFKILDTALDMPYRTGNLPDTGSQLNLQNIINKNLANLKNRKITFTVIDIINTIDGW